MKTSEGCVICGYPLIYNTSVQKNICEICGIEHSTNAYCQNNHYVCDSCHTNHGFIAITNIAQNNQDKNPITIAIKMMQSPNINMHGPEHHYLVAAALLTAYKNNGGQIDFTTALHSAIQRAKNVPGGVCGLWGSCGAGISSGIFVSIITEATPMSPQERSLANLMTSQSLAYIAQNDGPRCCKRDSFSAISQATLFTQEHFNISMEIPEKIHCLFSNKNKSCKKSNCLYFSKI